MIPSLRIRRSTACAAAILLFAAVASPLRAAPDVDPEADRLLRAASRYLADAKAFSVKVEVWRDAALSSGAVVQTTRSLDVQEQRPDKLRVEVRSPRESRGFWLQNKSLTMLDRNTNFYGVMPVPGDIDKSIDAVEDEFGIEIPLGDVLVADPYANLMASVESGDYLGRATILGTPCHHLAFTGRNADCQIWIADGPKPLPRKIVINFKTPDGNRQVTQIFNDWDLTSPVSDSVFTFTPPSDGVKIVVNPRKPAATQPAGK